MGCFSFKCKKSGAAVNSTSFDGDAVYLFLLKDGNVIEEMYGNYDSYGRVFKAGKDNSFEWNLPWSGGDKGLTVCDLMFDDDESNGIAAILAKNYKGQIPTTRSDGDPNQGWGKMRNNSVVREPYHKVHVDLKDEERVPTPTARELELNARIKALNDLMTPLLAETKALIDKLKEEKTSN